MMSENPYAPPVQRRGPLHGAAGIPLQREGDVLVVPFGATIPDVCLRCGAVDDLVKRRASFQWTPAWARVLLVLCALPGLVAFLVTTKRAALDVPLCAPCDARWTTARNAIVGAVVLLVGGVLGVKILEDATIALVGLVALVGAALFARTRMLGARRIDDTRILLERVAPAAMAKLFA